MTARTARCVGTGLALAVGLGFACSRPARPPPWACQDRGVGRRCTAPLVTPSATGWDCYTTHGDLACVRAGPGGAGAWTCGEHGGRTVCVLPGASVPDEPSPDGWQCHVDGDRRVCDWRRAGNDPWKCVPGRCVERRPDWPSADEWDCIERGGWTLCRGRFADGVDPRWRCREVGDRFLCLDPDPDRPPRAASGAWRCLYDNTGRTGRSCSEVEPAAPRECAGLETGGECFPANTEPMCWFEDECPAG